MSSDLQNESLWPNPGQTRCLNFLWISIDYSGTRNCGDRSPIPESYLQNARAVADINSDATVALWLDAKRHSAAEVRAVELALHGSRVEIRDLQSIPEYRSSPFFNQEETSSTWRQDKHSLIWRQVDAAKFLVCLHSRHDQVFVSDLDISNIEIHSESIQKPLRDHGMVFGIYFIGDRAALENQFLGFTSDKRYIFEQAFGRAHGHHRNGYEHLIDALQQPFKDEGLTVEKVGYVTKQMGISAHHPTIENGYGTGARKNQPLTP